MQSAVGDVPEHFGVYRRGRELGRGAFGLVFACEREGSGEIFAAKAIHLRRLQLSAKADRELKKLRREADILKRMPPHPNLVRFFDALEEASWVFFILEFVGGGDLFNALVRRPAGVGRRPHFREPEAIFVFRQLVEGLGFLHDWGVIHRDLKLENILVVQEWKSGQDVLHEVKIADFGLSKVVGEGHSDALSTVGSPRYMAPEVLARGAHDFRADLWSLGILLFVLLAGAFPAEAPAEALQRAVDEATAKLGASAGAREVVSALLQVERDHRLTIQDLREHPWVSRGAAAVESQPSPEKRARLDRAASRWLERASTRSLFGTPTGGGRSAQAPACLVISEDDPIPATVEKPSRKLTCLVSISGDETAPPAEAAVMAVAAAEVADPPIPAPALAPAAAPIEPPAATSV